MGLFTKETESEIIKELGIINPNFAACTPKQQHWILTKLIAWTTNGKAHTHAKHPELLRLWCKERDKYFRLARDFQKAIQGLITINEHYDMLKGQTKAYAPTGAASAIITPHLHKAIDTPKPLLSMNGRKITKPAPAIHSRDANGRKRATQGNVASLQPVNRDNVRLLSIRANEAIHQLRRGHTSDIIRSNLHDELEQRAFLKRLFDGCNAVLSLSSIEGYPSQMPNYYSEATSGRLIGLGTHLQSVHKEVKEAALAEQFDYDIANCHITLAAQLGKREGLDTSLLEWYINLKADKRAFALLADELDVETSQIKEAMIALTYGAPMSESRRCSLPEILMESMPEFMSHPEIKGFYKQIRDIRHTVVDNAPQRGFDKQLINHLGKPMSVASNGTNSLFSHVLQGYEAEMLKHAMALYGDRISLLSHDGFVVKERIDVKPLVSRYYETTGLNIEMEETRLVA